jgi:hypothetical protein
MTPNIPTAINGQTPLSDKGKAPRGRKPAKRKTGAASRPVPRSAAQRQAKGRPVTARYGDTASRLMSRGKRAVNGAYLWVADGAGRALPRAARHLPDQKTLQGVLEDRPFLLGVIGLGVGAMIGMMLPGHLVSAYASPAPRLARRSRSSRRKG